MFDITQGRQKFIFKEDVIKSEDDDYHGLVELENSMMASVLNATVRVWDISEGKLKYTIENFDKNKDGHKETITVMTGLDNNYLATADRTGALKVWDMNQIPPKMKFSTGGFGAHRHLVGYFKLSFLNINY